MSTVSGIDRFIFTVATGRCGQSSLRDIIEAHVPGCYPAFEEPSIHTVLPRPFESYERRFRRQFIETHELLGRGKVLKAFEIGNDTFIDRTAAKRLRRIQREMATRESAIYFDISKFFARGLHVGFLKAVGKHALVNLVRDPVCNMRSFLNRDKTFALDNNRPDASSNILRLACADMTASDFYLWAWCELNLRFEAMCQSDKVTHAVEIRTERLQDAGYMNAAFDALSLVHSPVVSQPPSNTNRERGLNATVVGADDIRTFEKFLDRVPTVLRSRIAYLQDYNPWAFHQLDPAAAA